MEIAADPDVPTYSGGLGVLAGDHLRAAADLGLPIAGVTLLYAGGYFRQHLDEHGFQGEDAVDWDPADRLERLDVRVEVEIGERRVWVGAWCMWLEGTSGHRVPVYYLDTRDGANDPEDSAITERLYAGTPTLRLRQEAVLGLAGTALIGALGLRPSVFHMNEGHAALVPVGVLAGPDDRLGEADEAGVAAVRGRCVFTTHTPVAAGHDRFPADMVESVLGAARVKELARLGAYDGAELNMTELAAFFSGHVNAVSRRHAEVTRAMFPTLDVRSVTNGVHVPTWTVPATQDLLDRHVAGWRWDPALLRYASGIPLGELRAVHRQNKEQLIEAVGARTGHMLDPDALTLCVARRAAAYKRTDLLLADPVALVRVADAGPLQVLYAGKAHPADEDGKAAIARIFDAAGEVADLVTVVYLEDYDMALARLLCAGADLWVNTPLPPYEASGTSGMKAALNAVPSLSTLDGWWLEGHIEGVTGWAVGAAGSADVVDEEDAVFDPRTRADAARELCGVLEHTIAPLFHGDPDGYMAVGRGALAFNGSFFTARRMVQEYALTAYGEAGRTVAPPKRSS
jgi:starch phosphorylase